MIQTVPFGKEETSGTTSAASSAVRPGDVPEPFETRRRAEMPEYQPQTKKEMPFINNRTVNSQSTQTVNEERKISSYTGLPRGTITMAEQAVREQRIYETKAPFTKAEEQLFEGTLKEKNESSQSEELISNRLQEKNDNQAFNADADTKQEFKEKLNEKEQTSVNVNTEEKAPESLRQEEKPKQLELFEEKLLAPESRSRHQLIGQIFDTYWLVQFEDRFFIIDQHAAHEKVYYERFVKRFREQTIESQYLSPPLIVSLNLQEEAALEANRKYFEDFGFFIEPFGGKEYCINAVPTNLYGLEEEELFLEMLDHLTTDKDKDPLGIFASRLATMACKAAVKGNHQMSSQEADKLIDELLTLENPYHCPHGRPTIISMTKTELEKKFKRIV